MVKQKKRGENSLLKWISISGLFFAGLLLILNLFVYSSLLVQAFQDREFIFFLQFAFSNNIFFLVLFALTSVYLRKANKFARIMWVVLSAYFVVPALSSLIGSLSNISVYTVIGVVVNIFLGLSSIYLLFNKQLKECFR